jgi:uncharacterized membrane protein HdeD (DUF308 family)
MNTQTNLEKVHGQTESGEPQQAKPGRVLLAITVVRGVLAVLLGLALIANPHQFRPMLRNFMGLFLLVSGIMGLRWSVHGQRPLPLALVIGAIATLVGAFILVHPLVGNLLPELIVFLFLGGSAVLMGIIHLVEGMPNVREGMLERSWFSSYTLGRL